MDQREWDASARLPRDRHAPETWSTQIVPESTEKPQWRTVADTGSLQPSPEALAWAQRAEAWAEQSPDDEPSAAVGPTGRETYPVGGVGWRSETAEWMAAEQTARWRQTTEWRSASGDHGWRSTTEAWQTGGNAEGFRPPEDASTRQQLAISGTAWAADQPGDGPEPAQPQSPPQTFTTRGTPPGWQQFDGGPPWQPAAEARPAWQQFAAPTSPWQAPAAATAPGDNPLTVSTPVWRSGDAGSAPSVDSADTASNVPWQPAVPTPPPPATPPPLPIDTANTVSAPPWQQSVAMPAQRSGEASSWQQLIEPARPTTYTSSGFAGFQQNGHRVHQDIPDVSGEPWRTGAVGVAGVDNGRMVGRRRAPEGARPPTAWDPGWDEDPSDAGVDAPTWRDRTDTPNGHHAERSGGREGVEPRSRRRRSDTPRWDDTDDGDNWDDRVGMPAATPRWRPDDSDSAWGDRAEGWRSEPDSGSWSRGEEPRTVNWRRRHLVDVADDTDAPGWRDAGPHTDGWRRDARPAADPWAQHASETGFIPMSWDQPGTHGGSWRSDPEDREDHEYRAGRRSGDERPLDPEAWRRDRGRPGGGANWPADEPENRRDQLGDDDYREPPPVGEAATEVRQRIDPERWQQGPRESGPWHGEAARGPATYRGGNTGDWRHELAGESDLAEGEARRFGTQDFVPFRPAGSAPAPVYGSPDRSEPVGIPDSPRWHDPPDTQWPPRGAVTGSHQRRTVGPLPNGSGRSNLLEPEDDIGENTGGPLAAVGYTVIWYGVPVVLFVLYMLVVTGDAKAHALSTLANAAPQFGLSLALSMLVAVVLRWLSGSWKAASVGLAAAVMGGGLATVLTSAITGTSLS